MATAIEPNLVQVRAVGTYTRGLMHWVERQPNTPIDQLPALCGQRSRRGWIALPTHGRPCTACERKADQL
jgi:hypothetical protein